MAGEGHSGCLPPPVFSPNRSVRARRTASVHRHLGAEGQPALGLDPVRLVEAGDPAGIGRQIVVARLAALGVHRGDDVAEVVVAPEPHELAGVDVRHASVASDHQHVLVVVGGRGVAEVGRAGDDQWILAQRVDQHELGVGVLDVPAEGVGLLAEPVVERVGRQRGAHGDLDVVVPAQRLL
ncbi:conserved hypothetical protein, partial [Ricinus communis]